MKFTPARIICGLTLAATCLLSTGCADRQYARIASNPTPELMTLSERPIDVDRHMTVTNDHGWRMFWEDLGRSFYTDHPSRLSPYPVQYTSGTPR